jgi:N,N'-diacetyllegionaminate synthase
LTYVIAEIGFNHGGNIDIANRMISEAAQSGATAVKFQTFRAGDIVLPSSEHFKSIQCGEMSYDDHLRLKESAQAHGIEFISTPFSPWAVDLLERVGVSAYKVASMDCHNKHLLGIIAQTGKPVYMSTGMAELWEIADSVHFFQEKSRAALTLMHCISHYPAEPEDLNLEAIPFLKQIFNIPVGYSDHCPGVEACKIAAMIGAEVLETHFTLDTRLPGADHHHSADPTMLKELIEDIRKFRVARGSAGFFQSRCDRDCAKQFRRGVYAARQLESGHQISQEDLRVCRPLGALTPNDLSWLLGKKIKRKLEANEEVRREDFF